MKSYEMVETLSEKTKVSLTQAKEALEKSNWDMLDAAIYIEEHKAQARAAQNQGPNNGYVSGQQKEQNGQFGNPNFPNYPNFNPNMNGGNPNYTHFSGAPNGNYGNPHNPNHGPFNAPPYNQQYNQPPVSVGEMLGRFCGRAENTVNKAMFDSFVVSKNGRRIFQIPLLVFLIFLLVAIVPTVTILIIGLFFDFKYSFEGRSVGKDPLNSFFNKAKNTTDKMKEDFQASKESMKEEFQASKESMKEEYEVLKKDFQKGKDSTKQ